MANRIFVAMCDYSHETTLLWSSCVVQVHFQHSSARRGPKSQIMKGFVRTASSPHDAEFHSTATSGAFVMDMNASGDFGTPQDIASCAVSFEATVGSIPRWFGAAPSSTFELQQHRWRVQSRLNRERPAPIALPDGCAPVNNLGPTKVLETSYSGIPLRAMRKVGYSSSP